MRRLLASVVCPLLLGFSGCGKKPGASAPNPPAASEPALPAVVREIAPGTVPLWPRVEEAYKKGPQALEALSRTFETTEMVDSDGRWNAVVMAQWFSRASDHFKTPEEKQKVLEQLEGWQVLAPDRAAPRVAQAQFWMGLGWDIRGGDWGANVPEEKMRAFHNYLAKAAEVLSGVPEGARDVAYHYTLLELARPIGMARADFDQAAAEAVRLFPACPHIGGSIFHYLAPRWRGARGEWEPYLRQLAHTSAGKDADLFYSLAIIEGYKISFRFEGMAAEMVEGVTFENPLLAKGLDRIAAEFPQSTFYASGEACLRAFGLNDPRAARTALARANGVVDLRFWHARAMYDEIATWTARRLGGK